MAKTVVNLLKIIQIHNQQSALSGLGQEQGLQLLHNAPAISQTGESISLGNKRGLIELLVLLGDIGQHAQNLATLGLRSNLQKGQMPNIFLTITANEHLHLVGAIGQSPNPLNELRLGKETEAVLTGLVGTAHQISEATVVAEHDATVLHAEADNGSGNRAVQGLHLLVSLLQLLTLLLVAAIESITQNANNGQEQEGEGGGLENLGAGAARHQLIGHGQGQMPLGIIRGSQIPQIHGS